MTKNDFEIVKRSNGDFDVKRRPMPPKIPLPRVDGMVGADDDD